MKPERILVATDFSEPSREALEYGRSLAEALDASLHVLYVEDDPILNADTTDQAYRDEFEAKIAKKFETLLTDQQRTRLRAEFAIREGSAFVEIVRYAREQNIDLIVMGAHGRRALSHMLLGSVAENVVRTAPCPVLTVRNRSHRFEMP